MLPRRASVQTAAPYFSLQDWRSRRPPMPIAFGGPAMAVDALYQRIAPSVYLVLASDHAIELAERVPRAQGGAVAISDTILITNCHVIEGRPQISLTQQGLTIGRAHLAYADPGGDRCFLRSDSPVNPVPGVRRFGELKLGEPVFSLGAPMGLEGSLGAGTISGFRQIEGVRLIQNTAPTAHGSSGGGLFDARGNLIGITTSGSVVTPNTFFSIAADEFWP
jgi:S1-C subfamily serine protease